MVIKNATETNEHRRARRKIVKLTRENKTSEGINKAQLRNALGT